MCTLRKIDSQYSINNDIIPTGISIKNDYLAIGGMEGEIFIADIKNGYNSKFCGRVSTEPHITN